ncbi:type II toxin-antitoxin system RelE family toxin [Iningainema tapete]|uniref:Type II toxin-antitoxin system RelE/ParE family toxin n=1 Tax=Iningainema tapete BLCC-T55 TaxID=2748662 RepID=A0A8J7CID3_9CYAN|nr:type II toxin-antitoxin system RelE/ParE family toxin [Iningainema tapete]MBD2778905.1 type II toxin-antitoxin system RelE/ParE family toxin [Iningainema tapete BLCC-T55]
MYRVRLLAAVYRERKALPGVIRQRIKKIIDDLEDNPRLHNSIALQLDNMEIWEARRIRVDDWRIIYAIDEEFQQVAILAIRQRPPYDYEDLGDLFSNLE